VALQDGYDAGDVVTGVDDDGFTGALIAEDGAVALEEADGDDFVNHTSDCPSAAKMRKPEACAF
jgi:hypothetical protein